MDIDPDYGLELPSSSHTRSKPPVRDSFDSDEEYLNHLPTSYLQPPVNGTLDSDDISVDETTSESNHRLNIHIFN